MDTRKILSDLRAERDRISRAIDAIEAISSNGLKSTGVRQTAQTTSGKRRRHRLSAAGRKRLSELLKKRWAQGKMKRKKSAA